MMPVKTTVEVVGVKNAINQLGKIDKELQKQFKADATAIAQPAIKAGANSYTKIPISNFARDWRDLKRGRTIKGFDLGKAQKGVKMRFDTRRNAVGVILIEQKDQAAAIFEVAGRANANKLDTSLRIAGYPVSAGRTRLIGPAVYRARKGVETQMQKMIIDTIRVVEKAI
jgi:hypothetical protein